jgi:threonyl-tRNA synthetase
VGDKEEENKNISFRIHKKGDQGAVELDEFLEKIKEIIRGKNLNYEI